MNIMNKLTIRILKENKRRTLVTIIGVIISVAMVTAVATLGVSFMKLLQDDVIATQGEWHVKYGNVQQSQREAIQKDSATKNTFITKNLGYSYIESHETTGVFHKPYYYVDAFDAKAFEYMPVQLTEGRLPEKSGEIVVSELANILGEQQLEIGDTLTLELGERYPVNEAARTEALLQYDSIMQEDGKLVETLLNVETAQFTIVGFMEDVAWQPGWAPSYTAFSYLDESTLDPSEIVDVSVILKKVNQSLFDHSKQLAEANGIESVDHHTELLRFYGAINNLGIRGALFAISSIIMIIIMVGSISLIYNAFAISVSERSRHLGMLSSVGATKIQKRNSVFFEGFVISVISIPIGIICGLVGIGITFSFINSMLPTTLGVSSKLTVAVTPYSILVACGVSLLTIFISAYVPAMRASRVSAIDAIRQSLDVKLTQKSVKTSKLVRKIFGMEADLGLKNLKRNKRRYQATVFSIMISLILFLCVSFFTDSLKKTMSISQQNTNYDIMVGYANDDVAEWNEAVQMIVQTPEVTESNHVTTYRFNGKVPLEWIDSSLLKELRGKDYFYNININALDEQSFANYAKQAGVTYPHVDKPSNGLSTILINHMVYRDYDTGKFIEERILNVKAGDELKLDVLSVLYEEGTKDPFTVPFNLMTTTKELPIGIDSPHYGMLQLIVPESEVGSFLEVDDHEMNSQHRLYVLSKDPTKTEQFVDDLDINGIYFYNEHKERQQEKQMIMIMSIFTYGFILLIAAISIANIFNTISTSISLRKREFGMLKSVGMTPKGFDRMIRYESLFYGVKSLLYGLPISIGLMYLMHRSLSDGFVFGFELPWLSIVYAVAAIFFIVGASMIYSSSKMKKENIIDALKQENI